MSFKISKQFILGGNAVFTVRSHRTNAHFTFRVKKLKSVDGRNQTDKYFVYAMEEYQKFAYVGIIGVLSGGLILTKASKFKDDSPAVVAFRWVASALWAGEDPRRCDVMHEGSCCRCGRPLDDPESIELGIGPMCRKLAEW